MVILVHVESLLFLSYIVGPQLVFEHMIFIFGVVDSVSEKDHESLGFFVIGML